MPLILWLSLWPTFKLKQLPKLLYVSSVLTLYSLYLLSSHYHWPRMILCLATGRCFVSCRGVSGNRYPLCMSTKNDWFARTNAMAGRTMGDDANDIRIDACMLGVYLSG